jgi:hypothetical protein
MRKVLLGTPCYDGKVHVEFLHSLIDTLAMASSHETSVFPVQVCHDALIQRARNDLVAMALEAQCDDLVFVDADQAWDPAWIFSLLSRSEDVVGGAVPKKSDTQIDFNIKRLPDWTYDPEAQLIEVECVGTGFLRISKKALQAVGDISPIYVERGISKRMVFDVQVGETGEIISEDNVFCRKWRSTGGKVWVDPAITCDHIGIKTYRNNFAEFIKHI